MNKSLIKTLILLLLGLFFVSLGIVRAEDSDIIIPDIEAVFSEGAKIKWSVNQSLNCTAIVSPKDGDLDDEALIASRDPLDFIFNVNMPNIDYNTGVVRESGALVNYEVTVPKEILEGADKIWYNIICYKGSKVKITEVFSEEREIIIIEENPDVIIENVILSPLNPFEAEFITITVKGKNIGNASVSSCDISSLMNNKLVFEATEILTPCVKTVYPEIINPGDEFYFIYKGYYLNSGTMDLSFELVMGDELDKDNNFYSSDVIVHPRVNYVGVDTMVNGSAIVYWKTPIDVVSYRVEWHEEGDVFIPFYADGDYSEPAINHSVKIGGCGDPKLIDGKTYKYAVCSKVGSEDRELVCNDPLQFVYNEVATNAPENCSTQLSTYKNKSCTDTDGGKNYFKKGEASKVINGDATEASDECFDNILREAYCENNEVVLFEYECPDGCYDGACMEIGGADNLVLQLQRQISLLEKQVIALEKKLTKLDEKFAEKFAGTMFLDVENHGRLWYVDPASKNRFYFENGEAALSIGSKLATGITYENIQKIPIGIPDKLYNLADSDGDGLSDRLESAIGSDPKKIDTDDDELSDKQELENGFNPVNNQEYSYDQGLVDRLEGKMLLQVSGPNSHGEIWYIFKGQRWYGGTEDSMYEIMKARSLGATPENIRKIGVGVVKGIE